MASTRKAEVMDAIDGLARKLHALSLRPGSMTSSSKRKAEVMDAFDGLVPSASASTSKRMKRPSYDVFINHRGPDVKSTLATTLYDMLTQWHLSVFLDKPELEYGDFFPQTLEAAMSSALVHIAIFSLRYAESPWCLAELSFMVKSAASIIPIFYDVDPTDLRRVHQGKGKYADAFEKYVEKNRYLGKLDEWKEALCKASFYKGEVIEKKDGEDRQFKDIEDRQLKDIVNTVLKIVKRDSLWVADHPVGMEKIVEDFEKNTIPSMKVDQGVQIIGIWGMGGYGKTTLAKELYNKKSSLFKWSSFVSNVRDASAKGLLYERQQKLLKDLCVHDVGFFNIEEGKETLSRHLRSAKVFIILDDVDHVDQLAALMPAKDTLQSGSLIIVTTREYNVLKFWPDTTIYKMKALYPIYAKQLFCWHAFEQPFHQDGFEKLVEKFLEACTRLPLSLKVIASQLKGEFDKEIWKSLLHKIMTLVPNDIQKILKISYDNLDHQEQEMFLDVACFFIGEDRSLVIELWNGLGWSGQQGLKSLSNKCLVEFDKDIINMHDHIRDLGRNIATRRSPYRFGLPQTIINIQNQNGIGIHGIIVTPHRIYWDNWDTKKRFPRMARITGEVDDFCVWCSDRELKVDTNCGIRSLSPSLVGLKYLVISGDTFNEVLGEVSRELLWLRWFGIGQPNLPPGLLMEKLRVLEIIEEHHDHSFEKLWVDGEAPAQLRHLLISNCKKFQGFPKSIGRLNHLTKIVITDGSNVTTLPDEFCFLKSLEHLLLLWSKLLSLPINFGNLSNLRYLDLSGSRELRSLPASFKNLMLLQHLDLCECTKLTLKSEEELNCLQNITKLEHLNLGKCRQLEDLPRHIANNVSLKILYLGCRTLKGLPTNLGCLSSLTNLNIKSCRELKCLPDSLGCLSSLTNLDIENCGELKCLPDSLGCLSSLTNLYMSDCGELKCLPDSLGCLSSLTNLDIRNCPELDRLGVKSVAKAIRQLSNLQSLIIENCPISGSSLSFGSSSLKYIKLRETEVCRISYSPQLETLRIMENHHLEEIEALPRTLETIYLQNCVMLKKIASFARLIYLREFCLKGCNRIEKIEGIENCIRLEKLTVESRMEVPGIESLEQLWNLRELTLSANKGPVIERYFQRMQEWPSQRTVIRARAVPDAASLVESLLPPNLDIVDSISNQKIQSRPKLVAKRPSHGDALMLCFVINCVSLRATLKINSVSSNIIFEKGRWALVAVFTERSSYLDSKFSISFYENEGNEEDEVEKGVAVRGEEGKLMEAFRSLLPLVFLT